MEVGSCACAVFGASPMPAKRLLAASSPTLNVLCMRFPPAPGGSPRTAAIFCNEMVNLQGLLPTAILEHFAAELVRICHRKKTIREGFATRSIFELGGLNSRHHDPHHQAKLFGQGSRHQANLWDRREPVLTATCGRTARTAAPNDVRLPA